jgi:hypothetical protein
MENTRLTIGGAAGIDDAKSSHLIEPGNELKTELLTHVTCLEEMLFQKSSNLGDHARQALLGD